MTPENNELSFAGQNIYVGIDAHRKSFTVSIEGDHLFYKTFTQPAKPQILVDYLGEGENMKNKKLKFCCFA